MSSPQEDRVIVAGPTTMPPLWVQAEEGQGFKKAEDVEDGHFNLLSVSGGGGTRCPPAGHPP